VEVVEDDDEGVDTCQELEQLPNRSVAPVALVLERDLVLARQSGERRKDVRELRADVSVQALEAVAPKPAQVLVERIDEYRERQILLELGR
jgi:hypothetical protein